MSVVSTLRFIASHPLNEDHRLRAIGRYVAWQVRSRIQRGPIVMDFVDGAKLLVRRGQSGATGNLYTGLHEYHEMAFVMHVLRAGDLFIDVGANVGSYTILAAAVAGANCIALEPSAESFAGLADNVKVNSVDDKVQLIAAAAGAQRGTTRLTVGLGPMNHVLREGEAAAGVTVRVTTVDDVIGDRSPTLMKIDAEGCEVEVLEGAIHTLRNPALIALIVETDGFEERPGTRSGHAHRLVTDAGYAPCTYDPKKRSLLPREKGEVSSNIIYAKDIDAVRARVATARAFSLPWRGPI